MEYSTQPRILFYVQHLLGIGHLMRARRIALALHAGGFKVTLVTGGLPVAGFNHPGLDQIALPSMAVRDGNFADIVDASGNKIDDTFKQNRRRRLLEIYHAISPDIVMLEAYPFGRRQLRFELLPLIDAIEASKPRPILVTSVRDVLQKNRKPGRDEETARLVNQHFDKVLVHGDPQFIPFDETFPFATEIADKIAYTGVVSAHKPEPALQSFDIVVSAGGGAVGSALMRACLEAAQQLPKKTSWCLISGPYLPQDEFDALVSQASGNVTIERFRRDFTGLLMTAELSISQAGYNTVSDVLQAKCRAVLLPFSAHGETEQADRAARLKKLGLASIVNDDMLSDGEKSCEVLVAAIRSAMAQKPPSTALSIRSDGGQGTAIILRNLFNGKLA